MLENSENTQKMQFESETKPNLSLARCDPTTNYTIKHIQLNALMFQHELSRVPHFSTGLHKKVKTTENSALDFLSGCCCCVSLFLFDFFSLMLFCLFSMFCCERSRVCSVFMWFMRSLSLLHKYTRICVRDQIHFRYFIAADPKTTKTNIKI